MADIVQLVENGVKKYLKTHAKAVDGLYPIGAVFISVASDSPATLFGGTWERFGQGRVLVSVDENDASLNAASKEGGSTNPLTSHTHKPNGSGISGVAFKHSSSAEAYGGAASSGFRLSSGNLATAGDDTNHNNWQPFITAYMWVRTA